MDFYETLDTVDERTDLKREFDAVQRFLIAICRPLSLSHAEREALEVAERYLANAASRADLEAVRVACWRSIEGRIGELGDRKVARTRAVICALYPRNWPDDAFSTIDTFGRLALRAGVSLDALALALQSAFAGVFGGGNRSPG